MVYQMVGNYKFHDMLHIARDMQMFGCPQNWDASPGEHNVIEFAK